ncbi:PAS domain S-box protein [Piscinibacter sp. HJYY11]|uniref:hybrid sensor histidine kinase/response regulator n=1 Tax=Piscinibacter sp. HJYY11 TaxID=2801333 RepID=UPI00191F00F0|nr:PAS domain S-box protein [Piscinibacter sp. HJYY11]MBL0728543.1 PAS domain S-box protein [Piscinibacter sp. HJYY11]
MSPSSILIVEDEAVVALDLKMQLEDLGYTVVGIADDAEQAVALATKHRPSLALMDIQLKGSVDGVEVAAQLRRQMDLPVIFLTSFSDAQTVRRAAGTAPYGYLTKPFQIKEVAAGVEVALTKAQMERAERGTERSLAFALQCVTDGVVLTNEQHQVRFMNPAAEQLTGWDLRDAVGRSVDEVVSISIAEQELHSLGHLAPAEEVSTQQRVAMANAMTLHRRDGSALHIDEWTGPIRDAQGQKTGGIVLLRNASHRLVQEQRLLEAQDRFRSAFDFAPIGMALVSLDRRVLLANEAFARMVGHEVSALIGMSSDSLTLAEDLPFEEERLQELVLGHEPMVQFEKRYLHADGTAMDGSPVLVVVTVVREDEELVCFLYQVHDQQAQREIAGKAAELAVERMRRQASDAQNRATRDVLARVTHEMRTPLNAVLGYGELMKVMSMGSSAQLHGYAEQVVSAGRHMLSLVREVLEAPPGYTKGLAVPLEPVGLHDAIDEAIGLLKPSAQAHHLWLDNRVRPEVRVMADPLRLRQALLNVGSNAIKYNKPQGFVRWALEPSDAGRVKFSVVDEGVGMTPDQLERLYQPYERLGQEHSNIVGTGLGLVVTRGLVERMGGSIEITSEPRGGTRVEVEFDAAP